jgi:6-phosphogluconolactonase
MSPMPSPPPLERDPLRIEICGDAEDLARHAAQLFVNHAGRALGSRSHFSVALSGGSTPRRMYELLTEEHLAYQVVWPAVHFFWSDERCVAPDDERSNYRMAREALLSHIEMPAGNVHRMPAEEADPEAAAVAYERTLRDHFGDNAPRFDLVLLGMGEDGHTASLFPSSAGLNETQRLVAVVRLADGPRRLTLTLEAINGARAIVVLVSGESKAETVRRVLGANGRAEGLPIQSVRPRDGQLLWLLDADAASKLEKPDDGQET